MRIELRILSGARAGESEVFEKRTILVGRKPTNDLRFDTHGDLDVSGNHAEFREHNGRWFIIDSGSTNGTFLNGVPVRDEAPIKDGDIIAFGKNGPSVEVRAKGDPTGKTPAIPRTDARPSVKAPAGMAGGRMSTHERVAIAVRDQTRGMKTMLWGSIIGLGALAVVAYWIGTREGGKQVAEMQRILAQAESTSSILRDRIATGDTLMQQAMMRQFDSLRAKAQEAASRGNEQQIAAAVAEIQRNRVMQQGLVALDYTTISERNNPAVAFVVTEMDGSQYGGTAFGITRGGLLVTNRHNVRSRNGTAATRIEIQFANTARRFTGRVVKVGDDSLDLALVQIEQPGDYPVVSGVSATGDVKVGAALVTIGFPLSLDLPMSGNIVNTTLAVGPVSKRIPSLLQMDSYGAHGLSGAPVFDTRGLVVGVVYGGPAENPQIIYAVPSDRIAAFIGDAGKSIIR